MTFWERLGIERTLDIGEIKRAYAKQLKTHHPEDDPAGYQQLREAYDKAISYAKLQVHNDEPLLIQKSGQIVTECEKRLSNHFPPLSFPMAVPANIALEEAVTAIPFASKDNCRTVDDFIARVIGLYDHFPDRVSMEKWIELLNSDVLWDMRSKEEANLRLLKVVFERRFLPPEVWKLLEECFDWKEALTDLQKTQLDLKHEEMIAFRKFYMSQLQGPTPRYHHFLLQADNTRFNIEAYLKTRYQAYEALAENELALAGKLITHAHFLFADDPDLLYMLGEYYSRINEYDKAMNFFEVLISLVPEEIDGHLGKTRIFYLTGQLSQAIAMGEFILNRWPKHTETKILMSNCYMALKLPSRALDYLNDTFNSSDSWKRQPVKKSYFSSTELWVYFGITIAIIIMFCAGFTTYITETSNNSAFVYFKPLMIVVALGSLRKFFLEFGKIRRARRSKF